jgi:outer membrane protein assembly factor BamD
VLSKPWGRSALVLILIALSACSAVKKKQPTLAYEERPVELLFNVGADDLDHHEWNDAVNYFREVERQHPYSEWSRRAILMTAYAHYEANNYAEAISDADRFISLYPGNVSTPYAYYLKAICYFEQIVDVGRDQAYTENAMGTLRDVIKRYPHSEYASDSRLKLDMVYDQLAGKEMTIGRFYLRNGDPIAAIGRFRNVVDNYQTTSHVPEALYRLVETYLTMGLTTEATKDGAVLGFNYPGDIWYRDAYKLLTSKGLRPAVNPGSGPSHIPRLLPFGKHKDTTVAPPAAVVSDNSAPQGAAATTQSAKTAKTAQPAKKSDVVHGVLGL